MSFHRVVDFTGSADYTFVFEQCVEILRYDVERWRKALEVAGFLPVVRLPRQAAANQLAADFKACKVGA